MSEIKTVKCDGCGDILGEREGVITLYLRTKDSPWFGLRHDYCEGCAGPIRGLFSESQIQDALAAVRRD